MVKFRKLVVILLFLPQVLLSQNSESLIYGKITLNNGETYTGQMRWEGDQSMWTDIFRADKKERPAMNLLSEKELRQIDERSENFQFGFMALWEDKRPKTNFSFQCSFGDIESLTTVAKNKVSLKLRNGKKILLTRDKGGDLEEDIYIYDKNSGRLTLDFDNIKSIEFKPTPNPLKSPIGYPVYGKVLTSSGIFEGYIIWDLEERLESDLISGRRNGTKIDIAFGDIKEIRAQADGSYLKLLSGKDLFLNDHDDVNSGNHGIVIFGRGQNRVKVNWQNFISLELTKPQFALTPFSDFKVPKSLSGSLGTQDGKRFKGQIIYDLDEIFDIEFLNGTNNGLEYTIPFWQVQRIEPQNDKFALVHLIDGKQLLLGDHNDVTGNNHGVIIRVKNGEDRYVEWDTIKFIDFD